MKYYIANENGDWWSVEGDNGNTLFIISEEELKKVRDDLDDSPDKLEQDIWEYGKAVDIDLS